MERRQFLGGIFGMGLAYSVLPKSYAIGPFGATRIAWTCDGNYHDKDDYGAAPMACALLSDVGEGHRLVHFDFNSNMLNSNGTMAMQMRRSMWGDSQEKQGATDRFAVPINKFFDSRNVVTDGVINLHNEIMACSSSNKLVLCLGGPAEILWRALQGVPNSIRQYVTVISHGLPHQFNESTGPHPLSACTGVVVKRIRNQNNNLNTKQNWGPWTWLNNASKPNNQFLWRRMKASGRADVSDSGMMYYVLYGSEFATPSNYRSKLA